MLSRHENLRLAETGPSAPAGGMLRRYWHPIALSEDVGSSPFPVRVLSEDLVLYRGDGGDIYLVGARCPHRGTSLAEGRINGEFLSCCYHGWRFDGTGQCVEQPGEPPESRFAEKVRIPAYAASDRHGFIWAYLGGGEPPTLPPYDILAADNGVRRMARADAACNYFQVIENSVDPVHTAILHTDTDLEQAYHEIPQFDCEPTAMGLRTISWRPESKYKRRVEFAFPTLTRVTLPFMQPVVQMGFWVTPVDDTHCTLFLSWYLPLDPGTDDETARALTGRMEHHMFETAPEDRPVLSSRVILQDLHACQSQGDIADRGDEMLGHSDRAVIMLRRAFLEAIAQVDDGGDPPAVLRGAVPQTIVFDQVS